MNKIAFNLLLTVFFLQLFNLECSETTLELRTAGFFHSSNQFNEIYGNAGDCYGIEASTPIYKDVKGWLNLDWLKEDGRTKYFNDPTKIEIANISFGLKTLYRLSEQISPYIGIGASFSKITLKNKSSCSQEDFSKWAYGAVLKSGINFTITRHLFVDIFVDYLYQPVHIHSRVEIGGFKVGVGLGTKF